ncbi:UNVERIFIED_CONTAM: hypothetical protein Sangu_2919300, partial [Sesamum angustifolium]
VRIYTLRSETFAPQSTFASFQVDETSVGLRNDPIIGEPSDDISSQSRRRGPNRGSQVPEHPDQRLNVTVINY